MPQRPPRARQLPRESVASVVLVALPWASLERPSLQLGLLQGLLERDGVAARSLHLYLAFLDHILEQTHGAFTVEDYTRIAEHHLLGDWVFAVPPFHDTAATDEEFFAYLRGGGKSERFLEKLIQLREHTPAFLRLCVDDILALNPQVVGFTTTFGQSVASLTLAKMLKECRKDIRVVFGGAHCDGPMGVALHGCFPWIDVVVRGDAEPVFLPLIHDLLTRQPVRAWKGLCVRDANGLSVCGDLEPPGPLPTLDDLPVPIYDDYFDRLARSPARHALSPQVSLPIETSRGCWWGEKQHCTFCGLNGSSMTFRRKSPERALAEFTTLAARHQRLTFNAVDNIIDFRAFASFLPLLHDSGHDFQLFFETKANLTRDQVGILKRAGVTSIQPGIESLSTPILRLIRKGVTALQNIRLLKWCAEYGIRVYWNVIYGIPGESPSEYVRMETLMKALAHFDPPSLIPLSLERFSPYFADPGAFGLESLTPTPYYRFAYPCSPEELAALAYSFQYRHVDGRDPHTYVQGLRTVVSTWNENSAQATASLQYSRGPGFLMISDRRPGFESADYRLDEMERSIFLACESGATAGAIHEQLWNAGYDLPLSRIDRFLAGLTADQLLYEEDGCYLSLAVPARSGQSHGGVARD